MFHRPIPCAVPHPTRVLTVLTVTVTVTVTVTARTGACPPDAGVEKDALNPSLETLAS